jgi:hypothetical protein
MSTTAQSRWSASPETRESAHLQTASWAEAELHVI